MRNLVVVSSETLRETKLKKGAFNGNELAVSPETPRRNEDTLIFVSGAFRFTTYPIGSK